MRFRKYHGLGNDFVMLEDYTGDLGPAGALPKGFVAALCDRHTGVGADGVIRILGPEGDAETARSPAVLRMDYYNADGGPAEMCGNGIRCLTVLARRAGRIREGEQQVVTGAGVLTVRLGADERVTVDMGEPRLTRPEVPVVGDGSSLRVGIEGDGGIVYEGTGVSMGNPHFVLFSEDLSRPIDDELVRNLGPHLETHPAFPERTNVGFVEVLSPAELRLRVWERGVGETLACGTGACAAAAAAASLGRADRHVRIHVPGGELDVDWAQDNRIWMTGPAEETFAGTVNEAWLEARGLAEIVSEWKEHA